MILKLLPFLLTFSIANAATIGIGDYRYGPDTTQNFACKMAEDRAKEHAISRFLGESIDTVSFETCRNGECIFQKDTINETKGIVKNIVDKKVEIIEKPGYLNCIVTIQANVVKITNNIRFVIFDDNLTFKENQEVKFTGISNREGKLVLFNFYNGNYYRIYEHNIASKNEKFMLPSSNNKLVAKLPTGETQSKELITFVFFESEVKVKDSYTQKDLREFLSSVPYESYRVVNRHVHITR